MAFRSLLVSLLLFVSFTVSATTTSTTTDPVLPGTACNCAEYHDVVSGDSCSSIVNEYPPLTLSQFYSYNPYINSNCGNLLTGFRVCVKISGSSASFCSTSTMPKTSPPKTTSKPTTTAITTTVGPYSPIGATKSSSYVPANVTAATGGVPSPTQSGLISTCNRFYQVGMYDTCDGIVSQYLSWIDYSDFLTMNPSLGQNCTGLLAGYYVCVGMPMNMTGNSTTSVSQYYPPWTPPTGGSASPTITPSPVQSGIISNCVGFYQAQSTDNCTNVASMYYIAPSQLENWNPALGSSCTGMTAGDYYCVANSTSVKTTMPVVTTPPSPTQSGITSQCKAWYQAVGDDDCDSISYSFGTFNSSTFISWNPAVGSSCTNVIEGDWYCVAVPGTPTSRTSPIGFPSATGTGAPSPIQSGILANCASYWLVGGTDNCTTIEQANEISQSQLIAWNPALKSDCSGLQQGYYICVSNGTAPAGTVSGGQKATGTPTPTPTTKTGTSPPTTTATGGGGSTPSPVQSGIASNCTRYYMVEQGDGCYNIATAAGITLDNFYAWNPAVGNSCGNLLYGFYVCIGVSPAPRTTITTGSPVPAPTSS